MAYNYNQAKRYDKAIITYNKILRKQSVRHDFQKRFSDSRVVSLLISTYDNATSFYKQRAKDFSFNKNYHEAEFMFRKVIDLINGYNELCERYSLSDNSKEKREEILLAAHYGLGKITFLKNVLNESRRHFNYIKERNPDYSEDLLIPLSGYDYRRFAFFLLDAGLEKMAFKQLIELIKLNSNQVLAHYYLALFLKDSNWAEFIEEIRKLQDIGAGFIQGEVFYYLGLDSEKRDDEENAAIFYVKAIENNDQLIEAYYRLLDIYEKQKRLQDIQNVKSKLINVHPKYEINYTFDDGVVLEGFYFDEIEFEMMPTFKIVLFWQIPSEIHFESEEGKIYKAGTRLYEIKKVKNLITNAAFEFNQISEGYPFGWVEDIYAAPTKSHRIVTDNRGLSENTQCLLLDNTFADKTSCITAPIPVDKNKYYLQAGWIKSEAANAHYGRHWIDLYNRSIAYNYIPLDNARADWRFYSQIIKPPQEAEKCEIWPLNFQSNGKAYFDNLLFIDIDLPNKE
jgi:hypothetical protein